ncbi:MAG: hypothetical protein AAFX58_07145 [Pseudomonadota bacterium]
MNDYTDEKLSALLDGELPQLEASELRRAIAADSALAVRYDTLRQANEALRAAYLPIADEPLPEAVVALVNQAPVAADDNVVPLTRGRRVWRPLLAAAAALVVGLFAGLQLAERGAPYPGIGPGVIATDDLLHRALEHERSGQTAGIAGTGAVPQLTFRSRDGSYCREVLAPRPAGAVRALACRGNGQWTVLLTAFDAATDSSDGYSIAGADAAPAFDALVDRLIDGVPLDAAAEGRAIAGGWPLDESPR